MVKQRDKKVEQKNKHTEEKNDNKESSAINQNVDIDEVNKINEDKQEKEDEKLEREKNFKTDIVSKQSSTKYERCIVSKCDGDIHNIKLNRLSLTVIWILAITTRMYLIHEPTHICWDETHFGKFANHYLNGTFFFDVHPPLGKMLLALAGWATGYDGSFPFDKPGDSYGEQKYVGMRMFCALLGAFCIPLAYLIVWELTHSLPACILAASLILFDHGCITISQYILLDPILMFFMMMSVFSLIKFYSWRDCPFSFDWWGWMFCTGYFLACTFSVKWVGLFVILFAGVTTIQDLWILLGDLSLSILEIFKHFVARVIGLIITPISVYLFFFGLHFQSLPYSGPGDGFFSSALQSTLQGNQLYKASLPGELAFGSVITLKNHKTAGALLHSHQHLYPKEHPPEQQQITGYSHKDTNNDWVVHKPYTTYNDSEQLEYVYDGDTIRLMHVMTRRNLHSHHEKAPLSQNLLQVTGYGENGYGDANDIWRVSVTKHPGKNGRINTVKTIFRLIHVNTGCALQETDQLLPKWGWEQKEMACNPIPYAGGTEWNVEGNTHAQVPQVSIELLAPSFFESVYESHIVMAKTNNGFKPKEGEFTSQAWHWPINYRGQVFSGNDYRIYLLGNPILWWLVLATFGVYVVFFFVHSVREKRGFEISPQFKAECNTMIGSCGWLLIGWALHYLPFYTMGRVLYFHHYFPAYLFSAMFSGILLEHVCRTISLIFTDETRRQYAYNAGVTFIVAASVTSFYAFRGLSYGMSGPMGNQINPTQAAYRWLDTWDI
ncbi:protein O-mannosyl-transferase 2-like isoform X2 [Hydractinia symbiolongicarpus]|uniref:protein O-mannosyl-transferase 2-like isoform X2 n=1 Tax=Hydractinia symbiolongicarpus TaxID=13093 RepID=UPI00254E380A|nr:protein O-mannosyl-transferase 2-like isoform X2 [Hydractinia symbiolongicarpus]